MLWIFPCVVALFLRDLYVITDCPPVGVIEEELRVNTLSNGLGLESLTEFNIQATEPLQGKSGHSDQIKLIPEPKRRNIEHMNFSVKGFSAVDLREEEPIIKKDLIHII
jgi:hypothetical protein